MTRQKRLGSGLVALLAHVEPELRERVREVAELEGRTVLSCYALQRVCWERGWLRCGTCEVTAEGWAEIGEGPESRRAA